MHHFKPTLNGKGLLAASIALLSGQALAEVAGRVSFVTGDVRVRAADGAERALKRGDSINGGDRISTGAGRVQVRFTDGGFVSLQPNSVFGVDEYLYANRKPEESSLFFSLLQGGMRTITGAIGKVNKKSYQVRTPVATIGIRGTEYRALVDEGGLVVSVGKGLVNVANGGGEVTGAAGQNIRVRGPEDVPALSREEALVLANGTEEEDEAPQAEEGDDDTVAVADVRNDRGDFLLLFTTPGTLPDSRPPEGPVYMVGSPVEAFGSGDVYFGDFDQTGSVTGSVGGLVSLYTYGDTATGFLSAFESGSLKVINSGTRGALSWGEFTAGSTTVNNLFNPTGALTLADYDYLPYIVGLEPLGNLGKGTATYTLQGATPARNVYGNDGRVENFVIRVDLDFATIQALLRVSVPVASEVPSYTPPPQVYTVTTASAVPLLNLATASAFKLDSSLLTVSDSNGACEASAGACSATIAGFFSGALSNQIGASYQISDWWSGNELSGVAALGLGTYNSSIKLEDGPGYTLAFAHNGSSIPALEGGYRYYDATALPPTIIDNSLEAQFDSNGLLQNAKRPDASTVLGRLTAATTDQGQAGALKWGRWYPEGTSTSVIVNGSAQTLGSTQSLHYILGPMTQPNFFAGVNALHPYGATATYTYQGGTAATRSDGVTGRVSSGSTLTMTFGSLPSLAMDIKLDMASGNDYHITGSTTPALSASSAKFFAGSGSTSCAVSGSGSCVASLHGFFAGQQAQQIGMSYAVQDFSGGTLDVAGTAAFGRGKLTPIAAPVVVTEPVF